MSNFERDVANTMLDAADSRTAHEKTRIRQLEDAAAHWEHKYANARQYNRNLEERIAAIEARVRELEEEYRESASKQGHRIIELEAALHGLVDCCHMPEPHLGENNENVLLCPCCAEVLHVAGTHSADCHVFAAEKILCPLQYPTPSETACVHEWGEYSIDNAKSPADPPERYVWIKCIKCGEPQAATSNRRDE